MCQPILTISHYTINEYNRRTFIKIHQKFPSTSSGGTGNTALFKPQQEKAYNVYIVVDMELKGLIREALIKMILGFDIALEIEEE